MTTGSQLFEQYKQSKKKVEVKGKEYYLVEGDLLLTETGLRAYAQERVKTQATTAESEEEKMRLLGMVNEEGKIIRWAKGKVLTYKVQKETFATTAAYTTVVAAMRAATAEWERTCDVKFQHLSALDDGQTAGGETPLFTVVGVATGEFIAAAFFPNDPVDLRFVYVDTIFFSETPNYTADGFNQIGVLRHELGHVLGFRHEHIRSGAPPICGWESLEGAIELSEYDPQSVMHYFCGDVGNRELEISELDRGASRLVYGPPERDVVYYR